MNKLIVTSLSPNTEAQDILLACKRLFMPWKYRTGDDSVKFKKALEQYFSTGHIFLTNSGRSALCLALQTLDVNNNDEILIQSYTCNAVPNPIIWSGANPVYVDIDSTTLNMSVEDLKNKITRHSKAIIVQHTFGRPAEIKKIIELARQHSLFVIEDCAHSLGSRTNNNLTGTFGDMAIFSFGRDKVISSVYGGALLVNSPTFNNRANEIYEKMPTPSALWTIQQLLHPILFTIILHTYSFLSIGKILLEISKRLKLLSLAVTPGERQAIKPDYFPAQLPNGLAVLAHNQFKKLDCFHAHRKNISRLYLAHLNRNFYQPLSINAELDDPVYLRYTVLVDNPASVIEYAKKQKILLGDWYSCVIAPAGTKKDAMKYLAKSCLNAENASKHSLNLPTHINISERDAKRIIDTLNNYASS